MRREVSCFDESGEFCLRKAENFACGERGILPAESGEMRQESAGEIFARKTGGVLTVFPEWRFLIFFGEIALIFSMLDNFPPVW